MRILQIKIGKLQVFRVHYTLKTRQNEPNNARERNIELVGNLLPGDYFGTIRFGRKEQFWKIRVKPHTPTITTTAEQLRGTASKSTC